MPEKPKLWEVTTHAGPSATWWSWSIGRADPWWKHWPYHIHSQTGFRKALGSKSRANLEPNPYFKPTLCCTMCNRQCSICHSSCVWALWSPQASPIISLQHWSKSGFQGWEDGSSNLGSHYTVRALFYLSLRAPSPRQRNKAVFGVWSCLQTIQTKLEQLGLQSTKAPVMYWWKVKKKNSQISLVPTKISHRQKVIQRLGKLRSTSKLILGLPSV